MSELYNPQYTRGGYGKYNKNKAFVSMEAGTDAFYLEDEANESQWIQNELRADLVRREYYSGVYYKNDNDIILSSKIFNKNEQIYNSFLLKPMIVNVNGYFIDVLGNNGFLNQGKLEGSFENIPIKKLNYIQLPEPPENGNYYDFVFLEMCFAEVKFSDDIWFSGNRNNSFGLISNDLFDRRINSESNRRIQLMWNIGVSRVPTNYVIANEDLIQNKKVFALFDESIYAKYTPAKGAYHKNSVYGFWNATSRLDKKTDTDDIGLWIAGEGLDETGNSRLHTTNGYSYAIPLFKIIRRNTQSYYSSNLLGGDFVQNKITTRPDGKFANIIYEDDIIDLRNFIRVDNISKVLHKNFEDLLLNKTNYETKLYSTYFGIDPIITDEDTLLYEGCNANNFDESLLRNKQEFVFVPGVEQEAICLKDNTYLMKSFSVYNANLEGITSQFFVKVPNGKEIGLFSLTDTVYGARLIVYIKDNQLFAVVDSDLIIYNFTKHINKFTHIAVAAKDTDFKLIINNKVVTHKNLIKEMNFDDNFTIKFGFADVVNYYAQDCIFDELEVSNVYEDQFNRIPKAIGEDNADISIDTQLGRKNYTQVINTDSYTFHKTFKSDAEGNLIFSLDLPLTMEFVNNIPTIYFDNESIQVDTEVNVQWQLSNNKWYCTINGLGASITYNLVIITNVQFAINQGLYYLPKKAYAAYVEKTNKPFYAVADSIEAQSHNIGFADSSNELFTNKDKLDAINPYVTQIGFCVKLKYYLQINNNRIVIDKHIYTDIIGVHSVIFNGKNVLNDFYITDNDTYVINLKEEITGEVELNLITDKNCCVYSPTKAGILNLCQLEEINDFGNGTRTTFTYRSNSKILALMQSKFGNNMYHYAYINNQPERINITIDGTFVHYTFENPPINKANIRTYIVTEYDLLRSERLEFVYEIDKNEKNANDIFNIDQTDIVYHENEIFVTTDGYGIYPYQQHLPYNSEVRLNNLSAPLKDFVVTLRNAPNVGDMVVTLENGMDDDSVIESSPYSYLPEDTSAIDDNTSTRYSSLRVLTDEDQIQNNLNIHGSSINTSVVKSMSGMTYNYNADKEEIPLFTFKVKDDKTHSLSINNDDYTFYMLNKTMPTLTHLPMIDFIQFKLNPVDILNSNKCDIVFDSNNEAHIIVKDPLPISTNLTVPINYCVPNFSGTFLKTFDKVQTANAIPVAQGFRNCSIDNKSFYSSSTLDEKVAHVNVFPFLIKDKKSKILKMGILAQYNEDNKICIEVAYSAMDIYSLNNKYLIRHI